MLHILSENIVKNFSVDKMLAFLERWLTQRKEDVLVIYSVQIVYFSYM